MATEFAWKRSSYSGNDGSACVECAGDRGWVLIRDSKDAGGRRLTVSRAGWHAFVLLARS
ncbi:DUF397 domain-containing protein [Lentzea sp. NPDC102401]|uniref:DUF397 domain-containing protein n=1 Tax=Lentzea sp. NPDC102401 TaxID=3364128 RepID=UPI0037F3DCD0